MSAAEAIGAYLRTVRAGRGLSQDQVGAALDATSSRQIGRWERGENEPGTYKMLDLLNIIHGSAYDIQTLQANPSATEEDGIVLAQEWLRRNPGKVTIDRAQAVFAEQ